MLAKPLARPATRIVNEVKGINRAFVIDERIAKGNRIAPIIHCKLQHIRPK